MFLKKKTSFQYFINKYLIQNVLYLIKDVNAVGRSKLWPGRAVPS